MPVLYKCLFCNAVHENYKQVVRVDASVKIASAIDESGLQRHDFACAGKKDCIVGAAAQLSNKVAVEVAADFLKPRANPVDTTGGAAQS